MLYQMFWSSVAFWSNTLFNKVFTWIKKAFSDSVFNLWIFTRGKSWSIEKFNNAVETLDQSELIQILDGPSVNLKFLSIIN